MSRMANNEKHVDGTEEAPLLGKSKLTKRVTWSCACVALLGSWQYGFSIGSMNSGHLPIKEAITQDMKRKWHINASEALVEGIWVASSAAFPVGGIFGAILMYMVAQNIRTMDGLTVGHTCTVVFSCLMSLSGISHSPELLIFGRFVVGVAAALVATGLSVVYVVEVSPQHLRGIFGTLVGAGISTGIAASNILGHPKILGNARFWPLLLALTGAPSLLFLITGKTFISSKGSHDKVEDGIETPRSQRDPPKTMSVKEVICSRRLRKQLLCAMALCASHQLTGLNGVSFNMNRIYFRAGISFDYVHFVSIGVTTAVVLLNFVTASLTDKFGRKKLLMTGFAFEGVSLVLLTISMEAQYLGHFMDYISVAATLGFWVGFSIGPGPLTLITSAEFFDVSSRSAALTISTVVLWLSFVTTVVSTPYMMASVGGYTFLPLGIVAFLALGMVHFYVPETKDRTFSEIQEAFLLNNKKAERIEK